MSSIVPEKESEVLASILAYLAAKKILAFRQQTGALMNGNRMVRFGTPGMADVLAFKPTYWAGEWFATPVWIECKTAKGRQSDLQKSFQQQVEERGHLYILARSVDDVMDVF